MSSTSYIHVLLPAHKVISLYKVDQLLYLMDGRASASIIIQVSCVMSASLLRKEVQEKVASAETRRCHLLFRLS